jgi:hypothetical protein
MRVFLKDQKPKFADHLNYLKNQPVMNYAISKLREKSTSITIDTQKSINELDLSCIFAYQLFPSTILIAFCQWHFEDRTISINDTIVQQAYIPPIPAFSQKIIFGVRIKELIDEPLKKGFSYETLIGHGEKGIATFTVEQLANSIVFKIHTFSKPSSLLTRILGPIISIPYQAYCTRKCLLHVKSQLEKL